MKPRLNLTASQRRILCDLASGETVKSHASKFDISYQTAMTHKRNALKRIGAHTTYHAIAIFVGEGWQEQLHALQQSLQAIKELDEMAEELKRPDNEWILRNS